MALPLIGVGAALLAAYAGTKISQSMQKQSGVVGAFPGERKMSVAPVNGAIVVCGVYNVLEHSGIWCDGEIIELNGNGLVRPVSANRFLQNRSGDTIFIAADDYGRPMGDEATMQRAVAQIYQYYDYHLLSCNCHHFTWHCVSGDDESLTLFSELNHALSHYFEQAIHWHPLRH